MLDPCDKGSETEDVNSKSPDQFKKTCADCGTSKTPLWRGGPAGPKSLCNACGIRSRKKKRDVLSPNKERKPRKGHSGNNNTSSSGNRSSSDGKLGDGLKQRLMALGQDVMMRKRSKMERQRRKLGEEEQAAVLLMALSYGSVYA